MLTCGGGPFAGDPLPTDSGASACPEGWELRHKYVVEALPRRARDARDSRTVVYMDSEVWFALDRYYDRRGEFGAQHI